MKRSRIRQSDVAILLEEAYRDFHTQHHRGKDPITFAYRYSDRRDQEVACLLSALMAYGNVKAIFGSLEKVFSALGKSPYQSLIEGHFPGALEGFCYRFTTEADLRILFYWIGETLRTHGSLENAFVVSSPPSTDLRTKLTGFVNKLDSIPLPSSLARLFPTRTRNLKYLLSSPERGSACKRLNLFLRWVIRKNDGIDLGIWKSFHARDLILPLDTHLLKVIRDLSWTRSQQANWRVASEATAQLKKFDAEDPVRFDFALCHLSMDGIRIRDRWRAKDAKKVE